MVSKGKILQLSVVTLKVSMTSHPYPLTFFFQGQFGKIIYEGIFMCILNYILSLLNNRNLM